MTDKIKAFVVGSDEPTGEEGLEVIEQVSVIFPAQSVDCWHQLSNLLTQARNADAMLIFQDAPPQVLKALSYFKNENSRKPVAGVIIMLPAYKSATESEWRRFPVIFDAEDAEELVLYADPNAKTEINGHILTVTVAKKEFSHIEWF